LKTVKVINTPSFDYSYDLKRIVQVFQDRGIYLSTEQAKEIWTLNSDAVCASWLFLPENDEDLFQECMRYCEIQED